MTSSGGNRQVVSISVPQSLRERMQLVTDVNWSAVARDAIERRLDLEELKMTGKLTAVERLRASKAERVQSQREDGAAAGLAWMRDHAEYGELEKLRSFVLKHQSDLDFFFNENPENAFCVGEQLVGEIVGSDSMLRETAHEFWTNVCGDKTPWHDANWVYGFVTATVEAYAEIRDSI
jgi:hypothetical protein